MLRRLIILTALLTPLSPAVSQGAAAVGLLRGDDYPAEAIKRREQGTVRVRLRVSAEGRVMGCSIIQSASPSLDRTTCRILTERARFRPAKGSNGEAIEGDFEAPPIRWVLPGYAPSPPSPPQGVRM